ncbi:MAG: helix-turn-helix domain-containing protein [Anaerolineales bacterium]|jgi:transposase-like protein
MSGKKGMRHYSLEVKLEAVRMFYEEGKTQPEIAEILGIRNAQRVKIWVRQYRQEGEVAFQKKSRKGLVGRPPKKENKDAYIARLEMENELLKKFHTELRKGMLAKRNIGSSNDTEKSTQ